MALEDLPIWFITAFIGAFIVKLLDLIFDSFKKKKLRKEVKVQEISRLVDDYGELIDLYRIRAHLKAEVQLDKNGEPIPIGEGKYLVERTILEPESRFIEAIEALKGADTDTAILLQITNIRLTSSKALDFATDLDKTGKLKEDIYEIERKTSQLDIILKQKDIGDPYDKFKLYINLLNEADNSRRKVRNKLESYI